MSYNTVYVTFKKKIHSCVKQLWMLYIMSCMDWTKKVCMNIISYSE